MTDVIVESVYFILQAEDRIRDYKVTGVQTCALPISRRSTRPTRPCAIHRSAPPTTSCARAATARATRCSRRRADSAGGRDRKSVVEGKGVGLGGGRRNREGRQPANSVANSEGDRRTR